MDAGRPFDITPFGVEAQRIMRLEKGHFIVGQDTDGLTDPVAGVDVYYMEYDTERAGSLEPLRLLPSGDKRVMAGFIIGFDGEKQGAGDDSRAFGPQMFNTA